MREEITKGQKKLLLQTEANEALMPKLTLWIKGEKTIVITIAIVAFCVGSSS